MKYIISSFLVRAIDFSHVIKQVYCRNYSRSKAYKSTFSFLSKSGRQPAAKPSWVPFESRRPVTQHFPFGLVFPPFTINQRTLLVPVKARQHHKIPPSPFHHFIQTSKPKMFEWSRNAETKSTKSQASKENLTWGSEQLNKPVKSKGEHKTQTRIFTAFANYNLVR